MRKILSVIMVVAMLVTSILPAIANVAAADAAALTIEMQTVGFVENDDGTVSADIDLDVTNNPGYTDLRVLVYYTNTEISVDEFAAVDAFADYADASGLAKRSTLAAVKSCFTNAGVATAASRYAADIAINCYDEEGNPITCTDTGVVGTLTISPADGEFSADMSYEIGIIVAEAYDADGNEVVIDPVTYTMAVGAKPENPYATIHGVETFPEDQFTINLTGAKVFANGFVEGETPIGDINVEFVNNNDTNNPYGIWGGRYFITYPAELSLHEFVNGDFYAESEVKFGDYDLLVSDLLDIVARDAAGEEITDVEEGYLTWIPIAIAGFKNVGYDNYEAEAENTKLAQVYCEPDSFEAELHGDGLVQTIRFALPDDAAAGDKWTIRISSDWDEFCNMLPEPEETAYDAGYIEVISVEEESFEEFTIHAEDITIAADNSTASVKVYFSGNAANNTYGVWSTKVYFYYPSELSMINAEAGKLVFDGCDFIPSDYNVTVEGLDETNVNKNAAKWAFEEKGFDYENEDYAFTAISIFCPDPPATDCITKDGHLLTLTFALPEGAVSGDSWYVGLATCSDNADVTGYLVDPSEAKSNEDIPHALNDGSITLAGDAVVEPEPPVHEHNIVHIDAVEAGCHYNGNVEYWYCADDECGLVWIDEARTQISNHKSVIIPAKGSDLLVHMDAVEPGCHFNGNIEYWVCYECEQVWADEALTQLTNIKNVILPAVGSENLQHVEAVAPTYEANGNIEYWYCPDCECFWQDAALTQLTNRMNVIVPMLTKATVTVGTDKVVKGEEANVAITLDNNPGLFIGKFTITYDASVLTLVEATNGDIFPADNVIINTDVAGQITLYFENNAVADVYGNGVLANLVFATDAEGEPAEVALEIVADAENNINAAGEDVIVDVVAGKVAIINCDHAGATFTEVVSKAPSVYEEGILELYCDSCGELAYTEDIAKLAGVEIDEWINVPAGEQSSIVVNLVNNPGVWAFSATFAFDPNVLEFVSVESALFGADEYSYSVADGVVTVYVEAADLSDIAEDGAAFSLVFNAISCGYSDIDVELVAENTINAASENVEFVAIDGSVLASCALIYEPYLAPTATEAGHLEYWYCEFCGNMYADEQGRWPTNRFNVYLSPISLALYSFYDVNEGEEAKVELGLVSNPGIWALSVNVEYDAEILAFKGVASGLFTVDEYSWSVNDGVITVYVESDTLDNITDNDTAFTLVFDAIGYGEAAVSASIVADNTINADGANVDFGAAEAIVNVLHVCDLEYTAAVEAACHQNGMQEYWYCADCDVVYADAEGRIVTNRKNLVVPMTAEIIHVDAVEATCHVNGSAEYWYCSECEAVFADAALTQLTNVKNLTIPYTAEIIHIEAVEPGCHYEGVAEHWYCSECDAVYADAALTQLTNHKNVIIPEVGGDVIHVDAVEAGCHQTGNIEYWYCEECEQVWADEARTQLTNFKNVIVPATAEIIHVDAVEAVCHQTGNVEYWYCSECNAVFTDAALTQLSNFKNVIIPAPVELTHVDAVEATCHVNGRAEYWYCAECEAVFADAAGTQLTNIKNLTIPYTAEIIHIEAVEPGCHYEGVAEHWYCSECDAVYADAALTQLTNHKNVIIPEVGGDVIHVDAVEAGCHQTGNIEYWYCEECEQVWADEARTQLTNFKNVIVPATAEIIYVEAVEVSCHQNGSAEYWYCAECEAVFADAALTQLTNVKNLTIPYTAEIIHVDAVEAVCHQTGNVEYWYCAECEAVFTDAALTQLSNFKSVITPAPVELTYVEAVEVSCHQNGREEYWYCAECEAVFADAAGTQLTNIKNLTIPYTAEIIHVDAVEAVCHQTGNVEYWYCAECEAVFTDAALTQLSNFKSVITPAPVELTYVEAVEVSCHQNGRAEYWYCAECEAVFADAAGTQLTNIKNLTIPYTAEIIHVDAVEAACHQTGNVEYWYCAECEAVFTDAALTQLSNFKNVIVPATAEIIHVDAVEAVCHQTGNVEYWYCSECNAVFTDAALTQLSNFKNVIIPAPVELTHVDAVEVSCHQNGRAEYWYCAECEAVFADAAGTQLTNIKNLTIPYTAEIIYVEAVEATCGENGNAEYWYCAECDAVFADAALTQLTNRLNVVIPATGNHSAGDQVVTKEPTATEDGIWEIRCTVCGELLEAGSVDATGFIIKVNCGDYVKAAALDGETININAKATGLYAKFAVGYADGVKGTVTNGTIVSAGPNFAIIVVNYGEEATIVATDAAGNTKTYTVAIDWDFEYVGGYTVNKVEEAEGFDNTLNVYAKPGMNNASVGVRLAAGVTYELPEGLVAVKDGGYVYFKALEAAANDTYEIALTASNGVTTTLTINYVFDFENVSGVAGGYMVDSIELEDGNVVNITAPAAYGYASFRFLLNNTTSDVTAEDKVDVVVEGNTNIHWMKIYNDGTNFVTAEVYVFNAATGVTETYTVNVTFGING